MVQSFSSFSFYSFQILHTLAPACRQPAAAQSRPRSSAWNQFLMLLSLLTDAPGVKRSEVGRSPRTTPYTPDVEMSPLDQFFFPTHGGCALHRSVGASFTSRRCCLSNNKRQQVFGGWKYSYFSLCLTVFILNLMNYISVELEVNQRAAACRYITHRCRIINPWCHRQGFLIWLAARRRSELILLLVARRSSCQGEITRWLTTWSTVALRLVCAPDRRAGRWGGEEGCSSCSSLLEEPAHNEEMSLTISCLYCFNYVSLTIYLFF